MSTLPSQQLVVIAATSASTESLMSVLAPLPASFPAPIVVAYHAAGRGIEETLAAMTQLTVRAVDGAVRLEPGHVYALHPQQHVEVVDGELRPVEGSAARRGAPPVELVLESASEAYGENLVALILAGAGPDRADGARHVKEMGGTVVVQNPSSGGTLELPLSLSPSIVDIVADVPALSTLLLDLVTGAFGKPVIQDDARLQNVLDQVRARSGVDFSGYKQPTIRRRLHRRMLDTASATLEDYIRYLRRHPEEYQRLASSFLIKVTDFFRDPDLYDYPRDEVLPDLVANARKRGNELRLWSAGCATGEEAYSLAILAAEVLGPGIGDFTVRIFATDLDAEAIMFGRRGVYPLSALKNLSPELLDRYFTRIDGAYEVKKAIRSLVVFGQHDLGQRAPFPRIDLALCRNVLIYFTPELQRRALQLFAFALRDGGYLVLGKAESTTPLSEHFAVLHPRLKVFRRQGERVLLPPTRIKEVVPTPGSHLQVKRPALIGSERELARVHARQAGPRTASERMSDQILQDLPVGVVVVNRRYDIQNINVTARRLLGIHVPALGEDVIHQAYRSLSGPLRAAIDAASGGESVRTVHVVDSMPDTPGEQRCIALAAVQYRAPGENGGGRELVLILVNDATQQERERQDRAAASARAIEEARRLQALLDESTVSIRQLLRANEELASANAALRSANEELLVGHEESQAAMEEIETLNEEQQATNEELETLNEELQATVEELNTTNDDLEARGLELADLTRSLEEERSRLAAVLASMAEGVLVVDQGGTCLLTNDAFARMFGRGLPPLDGLDGMPLAADQSPVARAARGEAFRVQFTLQGGLRRFEASGQPIRSDGVEGGVVVIRDISEGPATAQSAG